MEYISLNKVFKNKYVIPCFQREYSWEKEEIDDLLNDIKNSSDNYCVGIIITKTENGKVLLIDGQQRLTTLYMIAIYTGYIKTKDQILLEKELSEEFQKVKERRLSDELRKIKEKELSDELKEKEIELANKLKKLKEDNESNDLKKLFDKEEENISLNLLHGWKLIKSIINNYEKDNEKNIKDEIKNKLNNIKLYILNLDDDITNLNHYFEVMNSRGVQLSRADRVKAILMNKLNDKSDIQRLNDKSDIQRLNNLWYLLEDMKDISKECRKGKKGYFHSISPKSTATQSSIKTILKNKKKMTINTKDDDILIKDDNNILNLEYFLLYTLRLYFEEKNENKDENEKNKMFSLKDLDDEYRTFCTNASDKEIIKFLDFLIKTKINYEKYIVRYDNKDKKYKLNINNYEILIIQTCLRVSFTDRKSMHWLYETLKYFNDEENKEEDYVEYIRNYIRSYISKYNEKEKDKKNKYATGTDTPHIVLNYLDYLLFTNKKQLKKEIPELNDIKDGKGVKNPFKMRNSIEHYMPRRNEKGYKWVDDFGNIALLSYKTNVEIQNAMPSVKNKYFAKYKLSDYSIKLQVMYYMYEKKANNDDEWEFLSYKLRDKCIKILKDDLKEIKKEHI